MRLNDEIVATVKKDVLTKFGEDAIIHFNYYNVFVSPEKHKMKTEWTLYTVIQNFYVIIKKHKTHGNIKGGMPLLISHIFSEQ